MTDDWRFDQRDHLWSAIENLIDALLVSEPPGPRRDAAGKLAIEIARQRAREENDE